MTHPHRSHDRSVAECIGAHETWVPAADAPARLEAAWSAAEYRCRPIAIDTTACAPSPSNDAARRAMLECMLRWQHPGHVLAASSRIEHDVDRLAELARERLVAVHVVLTTLDEPLAAAWEPRASAPWRRLETMRRLSEAAIPVGVLVAPLVPVVNDHEIEAVLEAAWDAGARAAHYAVPPMRWPHGRRFEDWLSDRFPDRAPAVLATLARRRGGRAFESPLFLTRTKGEDAWFELIRVRFELAAHRLGFQRARLEFDLRTDAFGPRGREGQLGLF